MKKYKKWKIRFFLGKAERFAEDSIEEIASWRGLAYLIYLYSFTILSWDLVNPWLTHEITGIYNIAFLNFVGFVFAVTFLLIIPSIVRWIIKRFY